MTTNGDKELTVKVKDVAEILVAALMASKECSISENVFGYALTIIMEIFKDDLDDILEYCEERKNAEILAEAFKNGFCKN